MYTNTPWVGPAARNVLVKAWLSWVRRTAICSAVESDTLNDTSRTSDLAIGTTFAYDVGKVILTGNDQIG